MYAWENGTDSIICQYLAIDQIHLGDARDLLSMIEPESVALSVWNRNLLRSVSGLRLIMSEKSMKQA